MNTLQIINAIVVLIGLPSIVVALVFIGRKLQVLDILAETVEKLKYNIKVIADSLVKKVNLDPCDLQTYSPIQLTEKGMEKVKSLSFDTILEEHKKDFFDVIEVDEADTKYDVEISARKTIIYLFDKEYFNGVKSYLYNNPKVEERSLLTTLAVYLRDQYLAAHPEIRE